MVQTATFKKTISQLIGTVVQMPNQGGNMTTWPPFLKIMGLTILPWSTLLTACDSYLLLDHFQHVESEGFITTSRWLSSAGIKETRGKLEIPFFPAPEQEKIQRSTSHNPNEPDYTVSRHMAFRIGIGSMIYLVRGNYLHIWELDGELVSAELCAPHPYSSCKRTIFHEPQLHKELMDRWQHYLEKADSDHPDLPPIQIPLEFAADFYSLYDEDYDGLYGTHCGYFGSAPIQREALLHLVENNMNVAISYILRSDNIYGRVYAAEALLIRERCGTISEADARILDRIRLSNATLDICGGCIRNVSTVAEIFKSKRFMTGTPELKQIICRE